MAIVKLGHGPLLVVAACAGSRRTTARHGWLEIAERQKHLHLSEAADHRAVAWTW
jgi:hypothetical protein